MSAVVARAWTSRLVGQLGPVVGVSDSRLGRVEGLDDTDYTAVLDRLRTRCTSAAIDGSAVVADFLITSAG